MSVRMVFGVHLHQPVGNFDHVFENHVVDVYRPLVRQLQKGQLLPALLHVSGPLLEWLDAHDAPLLDDIGRLVADGGVELLLSGMYEPILAAIPRVDRVEQIGWYRDWIRRRFGAESHGLWLTERVWEPELVADLADAGVKYVLVDDRHFLVSGFRREDLRGPFRSESDGRAISVLAIDERMRYLIPFADVVECERFLRDANAAGDALVVYADDGEKFGGWPGTKALVYDRGWFDAFCGMIESLRAEGVVQLCTGIDAVTHVPSRGLAYLPTASYQEMETWALPPEAARRLSVLERDLGPERMASPDRALVRGAHWRNFLVRYPESNRLHKKMVALSALSRLRHDQLDARRAIGRAQCNDAYWHGVFGGLYLPHLRAGLWRNLAVAEGLLRHGESLGADTLDIDFDGNDEIWVHSSTFSAIIAPARGGAIIEYTRFAAELNYADVLTRRLEAYHLPALEAGAAAHGTGVPSIHEIEATLGLESPPPFDLDDRAIGVARVLSAGVTAEQYAAAAYVPVASWARARCSASVRTIDARLEVRCEVPGYAVTWSFGADGSVDATYHWNGHSFSEGEHFAPELSLSAPLAMGAASSVAVWRYAVETVAKSERGVDRVVQGEAVTPLFDAQAGVARILLRDA